MPSLPHIPFDVAITSKELLKKSYDRLTPAQRTIIRAYYGLPLDADGLYYWALLHGHALFDELGYPVEVFPDRITYRPKEYNQLWAVLGRRSGKTDAIGSLIYAYESTCGGHLQPQYVREGQTVICVLISQKKEVAIQNLPFIRLTLEESPLLKKKITFVGADEIRLDGMTIIASSPTMSGLRGLAMPVVGMDEVAFWYKDSESANPDYEVERSVEASQAQFPRYKRFGITSPWSKEGLAYKYQQAGTEGWKRPLSEDRTEYQDILVVEAPSGAMWNGVTKDPKITRVFLEKARARDAQGFEREYLARFTDSVSGFLPRALLEAAVDKGETERKPEGDSGSGMLKWHYVAAIDPAFRYDAFPLVIGHYEPGIGVVVDLVRRLMPAPGLRLNPNTVLEEYSLILKQYGVVVVHSDQYQLETLTQLALQFGLIIQGTDFTSTSKGRIYGNLQQLVNQKRLRLLDPQLGGPPAEAFNELSILERINRPNGSVSIAAPVGKHDDVASATALMAYEAVRLSGMVGRRQETISDADRIKTPFERGQVMIKRKQTSVDSGGQWDE